MRRAWWEPFQSVGDLGAAAGAVGAGANEHHPDLAVGEPEERGEGGGDDTEIGRGRRHDSGRRGCGLARVLRFAGGRRIEGGGTGSKGYGLGEGKSKASHNPARLTGCGPCYDGGAHASVPIVQRPRTSALSRPVTRVRIPVGTPYLIPRHRFPQLLERQARYSGSKFLFIETQTFREAHLLELLLLIQTSSIQRERPVPCFLRPERRVEPPDIRLRAGRRTSGRQT